MKRDIASIKNSGVQSRKCALRCHRIPGVRVQYMFKRTLGSREASFTPISGNGALSTSPMPWIKGIKKENI